MKDEDRVIQLHRVKAVLWALVGVGCGVAVLPILMARALPVAPPGATAALWLAMAAFVVLLGGMALELARSRQVPGYRWLAAILLLVAVTWGGALVLPMAAWLGIGAGIAAAIALVILLLMERGAAGRRGRPSVPPRSRFLGLYVGGMWFGPARVAALSWIVGAVLGVAVAEVAHLQAESAGSRVIKPPRTVAAVRAETPDPEARVALRDPSAEPAVAGELVNALLIDGNWQGKVVVFDHDAHIKRQGGEDSCDVCHHSNLPLDRSTSCATCHRRMAQPAEAFAHTSHVRALGGNASCVRCHDERGTTESPRTATTACGDEACHGRVASDRSAVRSTLGLPDGVAAAYADAMHGLCMDCHRRHEHEKAAAGPYLSRCTVCHQLERGPDGEFVVDPLQYERPPTVPGPAQLAAGHEDSASDLAASAAGSDDDGAGRRM